MEITHVLKYVVVSKLPKLLKMEGHGRQRVTQAGSVLILYILGFAEICFDNTGGNVDRKNQPCKFIRKIVSGLLLIVYCGAKSVMVILKQVCRTASQLPVSACCAFKSVTTASASMTSPMHRPLNKVSHSNPRVRTYSIRRTRIDCLHCQYQLPVRLYSASSIE